MRITGQGKGGVDMDKRDLANEARSLTLKECIKHLKKGKGKLYEAVLLRLAGSVLPRLNEHSGPEGKPIPILNILDHEDHSSGSENKETEGKN